jgi:hypothetical protein
MTRGPCRTTACSRRPPASAALRCDQRARWSHTIKAHKDKKGSAEHRTLWHPGAPTQTCCGVIQGAQLWGQCPKRWEPHPAKG